MSADRIKIRDSNIELLRVVAANFVIIIHLAILMFMDKTVYPGAPYINQIIVRLAHVMSCGAVNIFIMINGYYTMGAEKVNLKKPFLLVFQLIVFNLALYGFGFIDGSSLLNIRSVVKAIYPAEYFISLYCALYLVSPYINFVLRNLSDAKFRTLLTVLIFVFCIWNYCADLVTELCGISVLGASTISMNGSLLGSTIVNFGVCYIIGAAVRRNIIQIKHPILSFIVSFVAAAAINSLNINVSVYYHSPFVIGMAVSLLCLFKRFNVKSLLVNILAEKSISVYLLHFTFLVHMKPFLLASLNCSAPVMLLRFAIAIVLVWLGSSVCHIVYKFASDPVLRKIEPRLEKIIISC